jgi:hypothetical protein
MHIRKMFGWAVMALSAFAVAEPAAAACTNASFSGIYGVLASGSTSTGIFGAGVFQIDSDGSGGLTGTGTQSANGTIQTLTVTGTYSIAGDCTGAATFVDQTSAVSHYNIVLDNANAEFELIRTDTGYTESGEGYAQGVAVCGLSGKTKSFAKHVDGHEIATPDTAVSVVGRLTLDGKGNATATDTFSESGAISSHKLTGTYTANSNCTGSAQITYKSKTYNFVSVAVSAGKKLLVLETDTGTVMSGQAIAQ